MRLKTLSKMNVYGKYIMNWFSHIVDAFFILFVFLLMVAIISTLIKFMYKSDFFNVIDDYVKFLLIIDFYICIILHLIWCALDRFFDSLIEKTIPFIISKNNKMIIIKLINKSHNKHTKLHLELVKLEKAFNNKSDVYKEMSEDDFPCIHKFIRRFKRNPKLNLKQEKIIVHKGVTINTINLEKLQLHLSKNPKLLTLDSVDNELNDLINGQLSMIESEKIKIGNK